MHNNEQSACLYGCVFVCTSKFSHMVRNMGIR